MILSILKARLLILLLLCGRIAGRQRVSYFDENEIDQCVYRDDEYKTLHEATYHRLKPIKVGQTIQAMQNRGIITNTKEAHQGSKKGMHIWMGMLAAKEALHDNRIPQCTCCTITVVDDHENTGSKVIMDTDNLHNQCNIIKMYEVHYKRPNWVVKRVPDTFGKKSTGLTYLWSQVERSITDIKTYSSSALTAIWNVMYPAAQYLLA